MEHSHGRDKFRPCQEDVLEEAQLMQTPGAVKGPRCPGDVSSQVSRRGMKAGLPGIAAAPDHEAPECQVRGYTCSEGSGDLRKDLGGSRIEEKR